MANVNFGKGMQADLNDLKRTDSKNDKEAEKFKPADAFKSFEAGKIKYEELKELLTKNGIKFTVKDLAENVEQLVAIIDGKPVTANGEKCPPYFFIPQYKNEYTTTGSFTTLRGNGGSGMTTQSEVNGLATAFDAVKSGIINSFNSLLSITPDGVCELHEYYQLNNRPFEIKFPLGHIKNQEHCRPKDITITNINFTLDRLISHPDGTVEVFPKHTFSYQVHHYEEWEPGDTYTINGITYRRTEDGGWEEVNHNPPNPPHPPVVPPITDVVPLTRDDYMVQFNLQIDNNL